MSEMRPDAYSFGDANQLEIRSGRGDDSTDARSPMQIGTINEVLAPKIIPTVTIFFVQNAINTF